MSKGQSTFDASKEGHEFQSSLLALMDYHGLSQADLAKVSGISTSAVWNYCQGRIPKVDELYTLAKLFNVTMERLLTGKSLVNTPGLPGLALVSELASEPLHTPASAPEISLERVQLGLVARLIDGTIAALDEGAGKDVVLTHLHVALAAAKA